MKKNITLVISWFLFYGLINAQTITEKAQLSVKNYLKTTLLDPSKYKPVSFGKIEILEADAELNSSSSDSWDNLRIFGKVDVNDTLNTTQLLKHVKSKSKSFKVVNYWEVAQGTPLENIKIKTWAYFKNDSAIFNSTDSSWSAVDDSWYIQYILEDGKILDSRFVQLERVPKVEKIGYTISHIYYAMTKGGTLRLFESEFVLSKNLKVVSEENL